MLDSAAQRLFIHVPEDGVVHLYHRGEGALAEAGDGSQREAPVGRGDAQLVGAAFAFFGKPKLQAELLQQVAGAARVARRSAADADGVFPLRLEVEQGEESDDAIDL